METTIDSKYKKYKCDKLSVFDLDGTLWSVNSHLYLLSKTYNINFESIIIKCVCKVCPQLMQKLFDLLFARKQSQMKYDCLNNYIDRDMLGILEKFKEEGNTVVIITNAPISIANHAKKLFGVEALSAPIGHKKDIMQFYYEFNELTVATDNITDIDLINVANNAILIGNKLQKSTLIECENLIMYKEKKND